MPAMVTISKKEYRDLVEQRLRLAYLRQTLEEDVFSPPPTQKVSEVVRAFSATGKYNDKFLKSLAAGLKRSSHFVS